MRPTAAPSRPPPADPSQDTGAGPRGPSSPTPGSPRGYSCHACGKIFSALEGFDAHRAGGMTKIHPDYGRRCLDAPELEARGYVLTSGRWGVPASDEAIARLMALKEKCTGARKV